jgi:branched-chain amino acid transport system substrate-binding protein
VLQTAGSLSIGRVARRAGFSVLFLLSLVTACASDERAEDEPTRIERTPAIPVVVGEGVPVAVGVSAPITGPDARSGTEDRDTVIAAVARWKEDNGATIEGHEIEVLAEDDGCTESDIAVEAARRLAAQPTVVGVVGPNCSAGTPSALQVYADAGITSISGSATESDLTTNQPPGGFFFRTAYRNDLVGSLIGLFVSFDLGARTAYLIDDGESYGRDLADRAQAVMERNGVTVTRARIERGTVDFREVAQQVVSDDPDVAGFLGFNPEAALLFRQLRDAGFDGVFGGGDAAATPEFIEGAGDASEGVLFAGCQLPLPGAFVAELQAIHEHRPGTSAFTAQQADATTILLNAIDEVAAEQADGSLVIEPTEVRDAVRTSGLRNGLSGSFTFDANGDRVPLDGAPLPAVVDEALATQDLDGLADLGLVACQVQGGELVNLTGPGAQPMTTTDGP